MSQRYAITQTKSQLFLNFTHLRTTNAIGYQRFDLEKSGTNLRVRHASSPRIAQMPNALRHNPRSRILAAASFCRTRRFVPDFTGRPAESPFEQAPPTAPFPNSPRIRIIRLASRLRRSRLTTSTGRSVRGGLRGARAPRRARCPARQALRRRPRRTRPRFPPGGAARRTPGRRRRTPRPGA